MQVAGRLGQAVVVPGALLPGLHQTRPLQVGQVPRDRRLRQLQDLEEVADAQIAVPQQVHNPQPRRVGEGFEELVGGR